MTQKKLVETLNAQLVEAQEAYYSGNPTITDAEYDAMESQLSAIVHANPELLKLATVLSQIGNTKNSVTRINHARPMLSIENYFTVETFISAANMYGAQVLLEPKRDGISCELKYKNGRMVQAVTRGDGNAGEDMTAQIRACTEIPQFLVGPEMPADLRIRGELVMRNAELDRINALGGKQYSNTRNLVAGTMKQKDLSIVASREIILIPWDMYSPDKDHLLPDSAFERMKLTEKFGFTKYEGYLIQPNAIEKTLALVLLQNTKADIGADGAVIKADSHKLREKLGVDRKFTCFQHCFKPQNLSAETTLLNIEFGLGRSGKVTPVAILKPVMLGGAEISRASVCNETYMENLGLKIGCTVNILRSGDVIPYITGVVDSKGGKAIVFPTKCPSCGSTLKADISAAIVQRFCVNSSCPGKAAEQFAAVGHRDTLEIDNLGDSLSIELVNHQINDLADLFEFGNDVLNSKLTVADLVDMNFRSGVNTMKMVKSLQTAKTATWDRWIASLNIPMIGHSLGKDIAKLLKLADDDMKNLPDLLKTLSKLNMEKLGTVKLASIIDWASIPANVNFCKRLYAAGVRPAPLATPKKVTASKVNGINFCITGSFARGSRPGIIAQLEALGAVSHSSVTKNVDLLIVGEAAGSKADKATKLGIKMVDATWLDNILGK